MTSRPPRPSGVNEVILVWLLQSSLPPHMNHRLLYPLFGLPCQSQDMANRGLAVWPTTKKTSLSKQMALGIGKMRNRWGSSSEREAGFFYHRLHFQMLTRTKVFLMESIFFHRKVDSPSVDLKARPWMFFGDCCHLSFKAHVFSKHKILPYFSSKYSSPDLYSLFISLLYCLHLITI